MQKRSASEIWSVVHQERQALIDDLAALELGDWRTPSLCPGWDVHDVLAHLVDSAKTTRLGFLRRMVAAGFDFDRDNAAGISREKGRHPRNTLKSFEAVSNSTATPPAALATRLVEAFVHGEDIRRPLTIDRNYSPEHVVWALSYQVKTGASMGGGKEVVQGWRLVASDVPFEHGTGPAIHGSVIALLLAASGRPPKTGELTGPGARGFATTLGKK